MKQKILFIISLFLCSHIYSEVAVPNGVNYSTFFHFVDVITGTYSPHFFDEKIKKELSNFYPDTEYYELGSNKVGTTEVFIEKENDWRIGKIKLQRVNLDKDSSYIVNSFFYFFGATEIHNALGYKTIYYHSDNLINKIEYYDEEDKLSRSEHFFWNLNNTRLTLHASSDEMGRVLRCRTFTYNENGSLIKEVLHGNLSGTCFTPIEIFEDGSINENEIESYSIYYDYSKEDPSLLIMQWEDNGTKIRYSYHPKSHLLESKIIEDHEKIRIRHYYFYEKGELTQTIVDDGISSQPSDLKGMIERNISTISTSRSNRGILKIIEDKRFNTDLAEESLLKRTHHLYCPKGNLLQQEIFDKWGKLVKSQVNTYDNEGRLRNVVDQEGNIKDFCYDHKGNVVVIVKVSKGGTKEVCNSKFDSFNRLIFNEEVNDEGRIFTNHFRYDLLGNRIEIIDSFGNVTTCRYDAFGRITYVIYSNSVINGLANQLTEKKSYDIFGNVISQTDLQGKTTITEYNARNCPIKIYHPDGNEETLEYFLDGSLAQAIAKDGSKIEYRNDFLARSTEVKLYDASKKLKSHIKYTYSGFRLIHSKDHNSVDSEENKKEESHFLSEAVSNIFTKLKSISDQLSLFLKQFSFEESIKPEIDKKALEIFGQTYLAMSGYYIDETDAGVFGEREFSSSLRVTAINGILNLRSTCINNVAKLSDTHGGINIHYVFHPTGGYGADMLNAALAKMGYISPQVKLLAKTWKKLIQEMGGPEGGGTIIHYAHSIGGTNTALAKNLLTAKEQKMIHVITVGSASMLTNESFGSAINYVSKRDGVGLISYFLSLFNPPPEETTHVAIVGSHTEGWPLIDHLVTGKTYLRVMHLLGEKFIERYGPEEE